MLLPATPGWVSLPVVVCGSPPLLAGVCWRRWCAVCGVRCVVCGVWCAAVVCWWGCGWCVVWLVPRHSWRRFLCATPRHSWLGFAAGGGGRSSPLLAEGPWRGSPPLLAGFRCRRWCVVCGVWCVVCGVRRWRVWWGCGWCVVWLVPRHSWRRFLCATPRHSWLGSAGGGGVRLPATPGWGPPVVVVCFAGGGVLCCVCLWCVWVCTVAVLCCVLRVCGVCVFGGVMCGAVVVSSGWLDPVPHGDMVIPIWHTMAKTAKYGQNPPALMIPYLHGHGEDPFNQRCYRHMGLRSRYMPPANPHGRL